MSQRGTGPRPSRRVVVAGVILASVLVAFAAVVALDINRRVASTPPGGVQEVAVGAGGRHSSEDVDYDLSPPAGGVHDPAWQNCGFYTEPVRDENAVHSLEHGAVWISYRPDLPQSQRDRIEDLATGQTYVLASPYPGAPASVVASAWGYQLRLQSADDEDLERFIRVYREGPQTPEPGAACTGGVGRPA